MVEDVQHRRGESERRHPVEPFRLESQRQPEAGEDDADILNR
ncbi:hypothetical protein ABIA43_003627 [Bradyrhizobium sp. USDA 328]